MMNRIIVVLGCIVVLFLCSLSNVTSESNSFGMKTVVSSDSMLFSLGQIDVTGSFRGLNSTEFDIPLEDAMNNPFASHFVNEALRENLHLFPVVGGTRISNISNISLISMDALQSLDSENPFEVLSEIEQFSNSSLLLSDGMFLIGTVNTSITFSYHDESCLSGFISFPLDDVTSVNTFFIVSEDDSSARYQYAENQIILYPYSEDSVIQLYSSTGAEVWNNQQDQYVFLLEDDIFDIRENSPIHLLPLSIPIHSESFQYTLAPASSTPNIIDMVNHVEQYGENISLGSIPLLTENDQQMQLFTSLSSMLNGGIVFVNHSNSVKIDGNSYTFDSFGFTRVNKASVLITEMGTSVEADYALIFLGDHFYSSQAATAEHGVAVPWIPILLWIGAVGCFIVFFVIKRTSHKEYNMSDKRVQYLSILIHVGGLVLAFILIDVAFQYQSGISFFQEVSSQGATLIAGVLFLVEGVLWVIGYLLAGLPLGIIVSKTLQFFGFDKHYRHMSKGVSSLSIWMITSLYLTMFFNIILLLFNPFNTMI